MVVAGVNDQDVALAHLDAVLDHLGRIDLVVARGVREVDDDAGADEKVVQRQLGNVLAGGEKVDLAVEVGAQVVGVGEQLPVGTTISICTTRWRLCCKPGNTSLLTFASASICTLTFRDSDDTL